MRILNGLSEAALTAADLFEVFLTTRYGAGFGEFERGLSRRRRERLKDDLVRREREKYYSFVYKLKRGGLIKEGDKEREEDVFSDEAREGKSRGACGARPILVARSIVRKRTKQKIFSFNFSVLSFRLYAGARNYRDCPSAYINTSN